MKKKGYKRAKIALSILLAIWILLACVAAALMVASYTVEFSARVLPDYARENLSPVIEKDNWSDDDYAFLFRQTGLAKPALDELKENFANLTADRRKAEYDKFQDAFFYEGAVEHNMAAFTTPHDRMQGDVVFPLAPLHDGDVVVSSACHTFGWRNGHAALIVNGRQGITFESFDPSTPSDTGTVRWFQRSSNFMVLRLKEEYREKTDPAEIAASALERLMNVPYHLTVGIFSPKDQCKDGRTPTATQCAHIVWQAFKNFGYDIDSNGGAIVVPRDIARSPYFEVVQVNGFSVDKLW